MARLVTALATALVLSVVGAPPAAAAWVWPLHGQVITPYRNGDDPYARGQHRGIDIAGQVGAPVVAATGGVVRFAGTAGYSGLTVGIRTADGRYDTSYLHLSAIAVRKGERVAAGERLGAVGTTGRRSAAQPHLHFGVRDAGSRHGYHDPLDFLPPPARPRPEPRRTPIPVGAPARPSPVPHAVPVAGPPLAAPRRAPHGLPVSRPSPALRPLPGLHRVPGVAPQLGPTAATRVGPSGAPARTPLTAPHPPHPPHVPQSVAPPERHPHASPAGHGPDLGWALVCAGLLLAAAFMGAGGGPGRAARSSARRLPARLGALLRPLAGRG